MVLLLDGPVVSTVGVSFPADPPYHLPPIPTPLAAPFTSRFLPGKVLLTRESHGGNALPAILAYLGLAIVVLAWFIGLVGVGAAMNRRKTVTPARVPVGSAV